MVSQLCNPASPAAVVRASFSLIPDDVPASEADGRPPQSYKTFLYGESERAITLREEQVAVQAGTTGLRTWTAALHLAHHVLNSPSSVLLPSSYSSSSSSAPIPSTPPPVLELGAGTGFLSILLSQLGADVITTDLGDESGGDEDGQWRTPLGRLKANISLSELRMAERS